MPRVEVKEWHGGSAADLLTFLRRRSQLNHLRQGKTIGGSYILECEAKEVPILVKLSGIRFAGKALKIRAMEDDQAMDSSSSTPQASEIMSILQGFLQSRYDPNTKLLNLMNVRQDPTLASRGFFSSESYASKMLQALIKVAEHPFGPVVSVSLEQNNFQDISDIQGLSKAFPNLVNLSLANNQIATAAALNPWKKRFMQLKELVLNGNPISESQVEMKKVIEFFPRLTTLNGVIVRTKNDLPKLAIPIQQNFYETPEIQNMAQGFIAEFFKCWDSDRSQLLPLYDNLSEFSYLWDNTVPHMRSHNSNQTPKWLFHSRNLARASSSTIDKFLTEKLSIGPEAIGSVFYKLPKTKTNISNADDFSCEAWSLQNVRQTPDTAVVIATHGMFNESAPRGQKYSFDRYLVVLPGPNGSMIIASDMMIVRLQGSPDIFKSNQVMIDDASSAPSAAAGPTGTPGVATPLDAHGAPGGVTGPDAVVQQLMQQTGLNLQYATQCAQQTNFDLQQALALFGQHRGQLPADAFI